MFKSIQCIFAVLLLLLPMVLAKSKAYVELINGTPYDWHLISHATRRMKWSPKTIIPSGTSSESCISWIINLPDASAEAKYRIDNPSSPESFTISAIQDPTQLQVHYHENLTSLNNPQYSTINLGFMDRHAHPFMLAGNGTQTPYISTNPPVAWMQSTLSTLSRKTLREITMPMSHDAGANVVTHPLNGPGTLHNTQTQSDSIYWQLVHGARWLDIRPALYWKKWMTYHGSWAAGSMWGATGQSIESMIEDINYFTRKYPGELIVLDISHDAIAKRRWSGFSEDDWMKFYGVLNGIFDLWVEPEGSSQWDLSSVPFGTFVKEGGKSTVLVRVPCGAPAWFSKQEKRDVDTTLTARSPGCDPVVQDNDLAPLNTTDTSYSQKSSRSFYKRDVSNSPENTDHQTTSSGSPPSLNFTPIRAFRLPITGTFSHTSSTKKLVTTQLEKLSQHKLSFPNTSPNSSPNTSPDTDANPTPNHSPSPIHKLSWILTQPLAVQADTLTWRNSILGYAVAAHRELYSNFEALVSGGRKGGEEGERAGEGRPNLIELDYIRSCDVAALAMGINVWGEWEKEGEGKGE
ncbi:9e6d20fa-809d-40ed-beb6-4cbe17da071c [Sclerotinia trifoliorum]|uniref:9e6d20fa-809d-40ed-beb6-4cbe17da071c n=1 Tax=Sclerotinia trifoliorum TaxID=28548 RepID=A0A8H2VW51_9HELO|nr:9e6d20fa-809d-40ed-beb6-4cbe17da071c [Sclerotinia trifoliorum]